MRMRPPHPVQSILVFLLALGIAACESESTPTALAPSNPVVQSDPGRPGGDGSQAGDGEQEPGPPSPKEDEPQAGGDDGDDRSGPSQEQPEPEPEPGDEPGNAGTSGKKNPPEEPAEPAAPGDPGDPPDEAPTDPTSDPDSDDTTPPDSSGDDDLMATLKDDLDRELARLDSLVPQMLDLYLDLLTTWTLSLLQDTGEMLACTPLPYAFDADIIGPEGGKLDVGEHMVVIPEGALDRPVVIVAQSVPSLNVEMDLFPEGLSFREPVVLTLSYYHCSSSVLRDPSPYRIVYIDENGELHDRPSTDDKDRYWVKGLLDHFSRYAIAR